MPCKQLTLVAVCFFICIYVHGQTVVVSFNSSWKYLDNGTNQGTAWRAAAFNDATWKTGNAQLGYGDGDEATIVSYGTNTSAKYITTYFRKAISITGLGNYASFKLECKRDDGVIVYINGTEAARSNMPSGTVAYTTPASTAAADDGNTIQTFIIAKSLFIEGNNTIAVEVHQNAGSSTDLSFDLQLTGNPNTGNTTFFPLGSSWKYRDNGSNQGTAWRAVSFSDATWKTGTGEFGYGDGDEATVVGYGSNASAKYITTYFRKAVAITNKNSYNSFIAEYKIDDGIVIYVNGVEVKRDNMPAGTIAYTTLASVAATDDGTTIRTANIASSYFVEGNNLIAAEVHQNAANSTDISFDLRLTGSKATVAATIIRGPYLQMGNQNAITIRWRTDIGTDSKIRYGTVAGNLSNSTTDATPTTEHEVRVTGLTADTKYYYSVGSINTVLQESNKNYFQTAAPATSTRKIRIAAYGDCGNNSANQVNVRNAYLNYLGSNATDLWLLLGDNAYNSGLDNEFQTKFFNIYKDDLLKNVTLFPALGNHEYAESAARQDDHVISYFNMFTLPKNGECGGVASGKEEYYSFDYGDIHFICLDSYGEEQNKRFFDTTSTQILWLKNDLAANQRKWTIAYWHHPPYSMGGHNSDTDPELIPVRANLLRILERYGVDLVLGGHSHTYERSYFIRDHFGLENTFSFTAHAVSSSSAKYDGSSNACPYVSTSAKIKHGTVYVVAGSAGSLGGTASSFPHAAMYYSNATTGGSLLIEVEANRLDAKFIAADNTIKDQFTIMKDVNKKSNIALNAGQETDLTASWIGNYAWSTVATTKSIHIAPAAGNYTYYVNDNSVVANKCLSDTFNVSVAAPLALVPVNQIAQGQNSVIAGTTKSSPERGEGKGVEGDVILSKKEK